MINKFITNYLKKHLKVDINTLTPTSLFEGYISIDVYWDDTIICKSQKVLNKSFF